MPLYGTSYNYTEMVNFLGGNTFSELFWLTTISAIKNKMFFSITTPSNSGGTQPLK